MHMLRRWLGDADFAKGLHAYFEKHQYSNTIGRDLWNALGQASGRDVAAFMDSWLEQPGYPVLTVKVENDVLKISQKQFFIGEHEDKNRLWVVPLNSNWKGLPDTLETESIEIPGYAALLVENKTALRLNTENTAHYITDYQGDLLDAVLAELETLDNTSKLQIVQERRLLAEAGHISYADLLPVLDKLSKEESYLVVSAVSQVISALERFIDEGTEAEKAFNSLVAKLARHNYDRLGFEAKDGESDEDELVRQLAVSMMIRSNDAEASQVASQIFAAHKENLAGLPAAIRAQVLINEMKHYETKDLVATYLDLYTHATDAVFKRQLAAALAYSTDADNIQTLIRSWKDKFVVKPQDLSSWYLQFLGHQTTQETVWVWARENWDWIKAALGGDMSFDSFVIFPSHIFKTEERLAEYKEFFEPQLSDLALSRNIRMGIKDIAARVDLIKREKASVEAVVAQYAKA